MTDKTFTPEEVEAILARERVKERMISALLTAIQRARMAGDEKMYIDALGILLGEVIGVKPEPKPQEPAAEKKDDE